MKVVAADCQSEHAFALVTVGALQIGLPVQSVVHALPWPENLTHLPRTQGALAGVFRYRELTIALISLRQWLKLPDLPPPHGQVMVLRVGHRVLGLGVDAVQGLLQVPADQIRQVHHDDNAQELFHSIALQPGSQSAISLLDPARLMDQAAVWTESLPPGQSEAPALSDAGSGAGPEYASSTAAPAAWAVVRTGAIVMACRAEDVGEVLPMPSLQKVFGSADSLLGIARWRDRDLPVARILELLGLAAEQLDAARTPVRAAPGIPEHIPEQQGLARTPETGGRGVRPSTPREVAHAIAVRRQKNKGRARQSPCAAQPWSPRGHKRF